MADDLARGVGIIRHVEGVVAVRLVNQLDGQVALLGRRHKLVDGPVQLRVILAGPNHQQGRQRRARLQIAKRAVAEGGAADALGCAVQNGGGQRHPGRERGHAEPPRVDTQVAGALTDGGQGVADFGDDRVEPCLSGLLRLVMAWPRRRGPQVADPLLLPDSERASVRATLAYYNQVGDPSH